MMRQKTARTAAITAGSESDFMALRTLAMGQIERQRSNELAKGLHEGSGYTGC
jgi:hypothetical protein